MKMVRLLLLTVAFALGFVLQCETFQQDLGNFDSAAYLVSAYSVPESRMPEFMEALSNAAREHNVQIFATDRSKQGVYEHRLDIYADESGVCSAVKKDCAITEREYRALFSGVTEVRFLPMSDYVCQEVHYNNYISFIGEDEDIRFLYEEMSRSYDMTEPEYRNSMEDDMIFLVWGMIMLLMVALSCMEVVSYKKEIVVRLSLGESVGGMIAVSVLRNLALNAVAYLAARALVFHNLSGESGREVALAMFLIGCAGSSCAYLSFAIYDIRRAFSNAGDAQGILYLMYGLKVLATVVGIFMIAINISSVRSHVFALNESVSMERYRDCFYLTFQDLTMSGYSEEDNADERLEAEGAIWNSIYAAEYETVRPIVCIKVMEDRNDVLLVNEYARDMLHDFEDVMEKGKMQGDITVFLPASADGRKTEGYVEGAVEQFLRPVQSPKIDYVRYDSRKYVTFFSEQAMSGMETAVNPVVIYQHGKAAKPDGAALENYACNDIMFQFTDGTYEELEDRYRFREQGFEAVKTQVADAYEYRRGFLVRLVSFFSSLSVILFLLQIFLIVAINGLEYRTHAMELSLKKIFGYRMWDKNKKIVLYSLVPDILTTFLLCIFSFFINTLDISVCVLTGVTVTAAELLAITGNIFYLEKEGVAKALKGGCL